jgi:diguanylate cyclase (GGDEF)-like protein
MDTITPLECQFQAPQHQVDAVTAPRSGQKSAAIQPFVNLTLTLRTDDAAFNREDIMLRVVGCVTQHHDLGLVVLAFLVCVLATNASARLLTSRGADASPQRGVQLGAAILAFSVGVWATHFIGILAYHPGVPFSFDVPLCIFSLILVLVATTFAFALDQHMQGAAPMIVVRGVILAGGISTMHFAGMWSMLTPGTIHYDADLVVVALAAGTLFSIAAMDLLARRRPVLASVFLTLAVTSAHFIAMGSVTLELVAGAEIPPLGISPSALAAATAGASVLIMTLALAASVVDQRHGNRLAIEARRMQTLADATSEGIVFERDGCITDVNRAMCGLAGNDAATLIGLRVIDIIPGITFVQDTSEHPAEHTVLRSDGQTTPVEILWRHDPDRAGHVLAIRDLSRQKAAESQIDRLARFDPLTGLANRSMFEQQLQKALALSERGAGGVALHYIDLDRFDTIDEALGPRVAEQILIQAAVRLTEVVRETDTVARLGRHEFAIIQPLTGQRSDSAAMADRIVATMVSSFLIDQQPVTLAVNIGIAFYPTDGDTAAALIKSAALARRHAKHDGHGWRCFEPQMDILLQEKRSLERDLTIALQQGQFCLHYQPFVAVESQKLVGYEALLRWDHPTRGRIPPADFIPLAEECGLIGPIGNWVLATACAEAASWDDPVIISVNLSPAQFKGGIVGTVADVLQRTGLPAARLELEITEGTLMDDTQNALRILTALKAMGVKLAMDDFGTGYSSLSYLRKFPFDKIKIDRSFISDAGDDPEAETIVQAIIALGRSLKLDVTAEGVETRRQLAMLNDQGCTFAQGYLLGRPHPSDQLGQHIGKHRPGRADNPEARPVESAAASTAS